jgi:MerR family transcriptional regulator, light-induced transcriptional regulator
MEKAQATDLNQTYPLRTVSRLTGLSPELLRAWESRHAIVRPFRTAGGTRRYSAADLERLLLVKAAVDAGNRIGKVAKMDATELQSRAANEAGQSSADLDSIIKAFEKLDDAAAQRWLSIQLATLGPTRFAREIAIPLMTEIGQRWADGRMGIASEHLASGLLRSLLGSALQPTASSVLSPRVVFATPAGERHEFGLLIAALTALGAGASPLFLGADIPVEDLLEAVAQSQPAALALSLITIPSAQAARTVRALRGGMPDEVGLWLGGSGAAELDIPSNVDLIKNLDELEQRVALLAVHGAASR